MIKNSGQLTFETKEIEDDDLERQIYDCLQTMEQTAPAHRSYGSAERQYKKLLGLDKSDGPTSYMISGPEGHWVLRFNPKKVSAQTEEDLKGERIRVESDRSFTKAETS